MSTHVADNGHTGWAITDIEHHFDPISGKRYTVTIEGNETQVKLQKTSYDSQGATTSLTREGNKWILKIFIDSSVFDAVQETSVDTYRWDDEFFTEDLYSNPLVHRPLTYPDISTVPSAGQKGSTTAENIAEIEKIVSEKQAGTKGTTSGKALWEESFDTLKGKNQWAADIAYLRTRGVTSYELKRPVLTRIRTYSTSYIQRQQIEAVPTVFSTSALITAESFPEVIKNQMPSNPSQDVTPPLTSWGWRVRAQSSEVIPSQGKIQESTSWTFAAWSTNLYLHI